MIASPRRDTAKKWSVYLMETGESAANVVDRLGSPFGRLETYKKLDALGEGSYATVAKGISTANGHFVALKEIRLNSEEGTPFTAIREASLLKGLKHSNMVTLHDIIHTPNNLTFVFEYEDTDLSRFMEKHPGPLDPRNVRYYWLQTTAWITFCHRRKILHRDLKPQNILLNHNGELKLATLDFSSVLNLYKKTYSHEVVTLWYRPPDVIMGSTEYSTFIRYGSGCIFVEMLLVNLSSWFERVYMILGTPNERTWPGIKRLAEYRPEMYEQCDYLGLEVVAPMIQLQQLHCHPHVLDIPCLLFQVPQGSVSQSQDSTTAILRDAFCNFAAFHLSEESSTMREIVSIKS
ncbi:LOW QUALITY PROTEIN: cyclin-dependent kinase 14-like [Gigantopelta aegis]|uniref:LOW QUALITY PROTEIN: cyclin-dependent kinase 14-like n=1 Tax=Gigantopelta aegis TaxID=1735272 RepID=UPI001B88B7FD|nr:LOW QUALITY PROTEIN: cyclin-dependent kinase 14-like [Gigantopelta aegis]